MVRHILDNGAPILACRMKIPITAAEKGDLKKVVYFVEHATGSISFLKGLHPLPLAERI